LGSPRVWARVLAVAAVLSFAAAIPLPAERVAPLAPDNQHSYRRARNADHRRYHPVGHLV